MCPAAASRATGTDQHAIMRVGGAPQVESPLMEIDDLVCYCFHVRKRKILNFLRIRKPSRPSQVSECGGAGTGCGWCIPYLKRYFAQYQSGSTDALHQDEPDAATYAAGREQHIADGKGKPPT